VSVALHTEGRHAGQSMFRETLVRELGGAKTLCICGQNPSKAEADDPSVNDPTILREIGFARRLGFGRLVKVNSYDYRSTDPAELYRWLYSIKSLDEREAHRARALAIIIREAKAADMFIAAWGNGDGKDFWPKQLANELALAGIDVYVFGFTQTRMPKHTLARGTHRIPDDQRPILWLKGMAS
jgi:hypothetical protein